MNVDQRLALSVAVNLAYPVGDLLLLALAVGALVVVPGTPARLLIFGTGCVVMAIGDTVYLFQSSAGTYQVGTLVDADLAAGHLRHVARRSGSGVGNSAAPRGGAGARAWSSRPSPPWPAW